MSARSRVPIESLCKVAATLSGLRSIERVGEVIRDAALELVGCDGTSVLLADGRGFVHPHPSLLQRLRGGDEGAVAASAAGWALRHRCPALVKDAACDPRAPLARTPVASLAAVPLLPAPSQLGAALPAPLGAIEFCWSARHAITHEELQRLRALAELTALALHALQRRGEREALGPHAQTRSARTPTADQAALAVPTELVEHGRPLLDAAAWLGRDADGQGLIDPLTGLHSLRGLLSLGEALLHQGRSDQRPISVLYIEVRGASELQERFDDGSCDPSIDLLLRAAADVLRREVPAGELLARARGGELCAVLRGSPRDGAQLVSRLSRLCRGGAPALRLAMVRDDGDPSTHLEGLVQRARSLLQGLRRTERVFTADLATLRLWRAAHPVAARRSPSRLCAAAS